MSDSSAPLNLPWSRIRISSGEGVITESVSSVGVRMLGTIVAKGISVRLKGMGVKTRFFGIFG